MSFNRLPVLIVCAAAFLGTALNAQDINVTFYYESTAGTPVVYAAGDFNGWAAADPAYLFTDVDRDGIYTLTTGMTAGTHTYKLVVDGTWTRDPWNPATDGSQYQNSQLQVADPMVTYLLPVDGSAVNGGDAEIKAVIAATDSQVNADSFNVYLNGNLLVMGPGAYNPGTQTLTYVPADSELITGANRCSVAVRTGETGYTAVSEFQYSRGRFFMVSGTVTEDGGGPLGNITVVYGPDDTVYTGDDGVYSFMLPENGSAIVEPFDTGYTFAPAQIPVDNISHDTPGIDFTATSGGGSGSYTVGGAVTDAGGSSINVPPVRIEWVGATQVFARPDGMYSVPVTAHTTITLVPSFAGFYFIPDTVTITDIQRDHTDLNFIMLPEGTVLGTVTVSGTVAQEGAGIAGVALSYADTTVYTDVSGTYAITVFNSGLVSLEPQLAGYTFQPAKREFMNLADDSSGVNFNAVPDEDTITGRVVFAGTDTGFGGITVYLGDGKGGSVSTVTGPLGAYRFPVATGDGSQVYQVTADAPDGFMLEPVRYSISPDDHSRYHDNDFSAELTLVADTASADTAAADSGGTGTGGGSALPVAMVAGINGDGHISLAWQGPVTDFIREYRISRESTQQGVFSPMDTISYGSDEVWTDTAANPAVQAFTYRLAAVTVYGQEVVAGTHRTVHLTINKGVGDAWNLIWTPYLGKIVSTYRLYRGIAADSVEFLTDIAGNLTSYTDLAPPMGTAYYQIEAMLQDDGSSGEPETLMVLSRAAATAGAPASYLTARSNIVNSYAVGVADMLPIDNEQADMPVLTHTGMPYVFSGGGVLSVRITDIQGRQVVHLAGTGRIVWDGGIEPGMYTVRTERNGVAAIRKMVVMP